MIALRCSLARAKSSIGYERLQANTACIMASRSPPLAIVALIQVNAAAGSLLLISHHV
jgi:hypothetical protein